MSVLVKFGEWLAQSTIRNDKKSIKLLHYQIVEREETIRDLRNIRMDIEKNLVEFGRDSVEVALYTSPVVQDMTTVYTDSIDVASKVLNMKQSAACCYYEPELADKLYPETRDWLASRIAETVYEDLKG